MFILIERYLDMTHIGRAPSTVRFTRLTLKGFCKFMQNRVLDAESLADYGNYIYERYNGQNVNLNWGKTKRFINWLFNTRRIASNPVELISAPKCDPSQRTALITTMQGQRVLEVNKNSPLLWLLKMGFHTGMNIGDCACLQIRNIHHDKKNLSIRLSRMKTSRTRGRGEVEIILVPNSELYHMVYERLATYKEDYKNHPANNPDLGIYYLDPYSADQYLRHKKNINGKFLNNIKTCFTKAGLEVQTFRSFRVRWCTLVANDPDIPIMIACRMTGHSTPAGLAPYVRTNRAQLRAAYHKISLRKNYEDSCDNRLLSDDSVYSPECEEAPIFAGTGNPDSAIRRCIEGVQDDQQPGPDNVVRLRIGRT